MPRPSINYYVAGPAESNGSSGIGSYIPTFGHIATAVDSYRCVAVAGVQNHPGSWCFTDTDAASGLGRVVDGPIRARADIDRAETALRAILLYEVVDVIVPSVKIVHDNGFVGYARFDEGIRNAAAFEAFNASSSCSDYLLASELVHVRNGEIVASTNKSSRLVGKAIDDRDGGFNSEVQL